MFSYCFAYVFVWFVRFFFPARSLKNSLRVRSWFLVFVLSVLGFATTSSCFFRLSASFLRETDQANRTPHLPARFVGLSFFLCLSPRRSFCCPPFFGRASFCFWRFSGCHSGPQVFLGFSLDSLILVLGREAARAFGLFLVFVVFGFPFCRVCGLTR